MDSLSDIDLRGFVYDVDQRVIEFFCIFDKKQKVLEELLDDIEREFFGIGKDATKSDLDKAYRKLAKRMHPDKNGGTTSANQAFQNMLERYKRLRCKCRESVDETDLATGYVNRIVLRACAKEDEAVRCFVDRLSAKSFKRASNRAVAREVQLEVFDVQAPHTEPQKEQPEKAMNEDYTSRQYLEKRAKILIRQYKALQENVSKIDRDLDRLQVVRKA